MKYGAAISNQIRGLLDDYVTETACLFCDLFLLQEDPVFQFRSFIHREDDAEARFAA